MAIDLLEPKPCPDPQRDYMPESKEYITLLQIADTVPITGHRCSIVYTKEVTRCGFNSITYGTTKAATERRYDLAPSECRHAVVTGEITVHGRNYQILALGQPQVYSFYTHGGVARDGSCFASEGIWFDNSYEHYRVSITIEAIRGTADLSDGTAKFSNGLTADFHDGVVRDLFEGTIIWNTTIPDCEERTSTVYEGSAQAHRRIREPTQTPATTDQSQTSAHRRPIDWEDAVFIINNQGKEQFAGVVIREPTRVCDMLCHSTHIKGIVICISGEQPHVKNIETQLAFLHLRMNLDDLQRFSEIQHHLCRLERKSLYNKLQAIAGGRNPYALMDIATRGHRLYVAGAVAYIIKCKVIEATLTSYPNCTKEIPVTTGNASDVVHRFADPITKVLTDYPTVLPCSELMPVRWRIMDTWHCSYPQLRACHEQATQLEPQAIRLKRRDFTQGMGQGIYTDEMRAQHRSFQRAYDARDAVVAKISNTASSHQGKYEHYGGLGIALDQADMQTVTHSVGSWLFPIFPLVGEWWHFIAGGMLFIVIAKTIFGCAIRAAILYTERGCGCWILAAFWATLFMVARIPFEIVSHTTRHLFNRRGGRNDVDEEANMAHDNGDDDDDDDPPPPFQHQVHGFAALRRKLKMRASSNSSGQYWPACTHRVSGRRRSRRLGHSAASRLQQQQQLAQLLHYAPTGTAQQPPRPRSHNRQQQQRQDQPAPTYRQDEASTLTDYSDRDSQLTLTGQPSAAAAPPPSNYKPQQQQHDSSHTPAGRGLRRNGRPAASHSEPTSPAPPPQQTPPTTAANEQQQQQQQDAAAALQPPRRIGYYRGRYYHSDGSHCA
jgi:hypothetical protein